MKSKVLIITLAVLIFGIGFAVYAYNSTPTTDTAAVSCCCCSGDSCPMKAGEAKPDKVAMTEGAHSCCACCGDSCPMKAKSADGKTEAAHSCCGDSCPMKAGKKMDGMAGHEGMKHDAKMADGASCPMMKDGKKADAHKGMKHATDATGTHSCSCACCAHGKEKKTTAAI